MKKKLFLFILLLGIGGTGLSANTNNHTKTSIHKIKSLKEFWKQDINEIKKDIYNNINNRIIVLNKIKTCVEKAGSKKDIYKCRNIKKK